MRLFQILLVLFITNSALAAGPVDLSKEANFSSRVEAFAKEYDLKKQLAEFDRDQSPKIEKLFRADFSFRDDCDESRPSKASCITSVCDFLGVFGCDDRNEITQVGEACRGNRDGACVKATCKYLGVFGCDDMSEVTQVAGACRGVRNTECVDTVCARLGAFGCDDLNEIKEVLQACR